MTTTLQNLLPRLLLLAALALTPAYGAEPVGTGVLAYRPKPQTLAAVLTTGRADYAPVTDLLNCDTVPSFDLADLWRQYKTWIAAIFMLGLLLGAGANLLMQNRRIRQGEQRFATLFEHSPEPMWMMVDRRFIDCNPAFVQTFGYTLADIPTLAAWWQKACPDPAYRQQAQTAWQTSIETARREQAEFVPLELAIRCKDNSVKTVMATAAAINHDFSGVHLVILYDISERKQIEAELIRSNAELEQFAYAVSHDMRQPLRMVSSYLALIENALAGKLDEDTLQCLDFALNGAKRMDAMILSLLDYSRIGRVSADKTRISSKAALDEALAFLGPEISACGGAVKVDGEWPELLASPDELTRLLQNLIGNGLKYHRDEQPPQVDVHGEVCGTVLRVAVRDQGIGIAPNQTDRLFKVFSRLQARSRFEGAGVGLALCRKIVEHHGGGIGVESEGEGHGCLFWFELPL